MDNGNFETNYLDGVFADTKSIPEFNGLVTGARNNLAVVGRKSDTQNILGVATESPCCLTTEGGKKQQSIVGDQNYYNAGPKESLN